MSFSSPRLKLAPSVVLVLGVHLSVCLLSDVRPSIIEYNIELHSYWSAGSQQITLHYFPQQKHSTNMSSGANCFIERKRREALFFPLVIFLAYSFVYVDAIAVRVCQSSSLRWWISAVCSVLQAPCLCSGATCLLCSCCPKSRNSTVTRIIYASILLMGTIVSCIMLSPGVDQQLKRVPQCSSELKEESLMGLS